MHAIINKGLATLLPELAIARKELQDSISKFLERDGYLPLFSPHIGDIKLFTKSGHYPYYKDGMFPLIEEFVEAPEDDENAFVRSPDVFALKPMNCPFHIEAYQSEPRSYRELPIRYYEFGTVYRNEDSGAINGLFRLRGFTQDDGHIFCTEDQIQEEIQKCIELVRSVMSWFNMKIGVRVSLRDDDREKWIGSKDLWDRAEKALAAALPPDSSIVPDKGAAAFYGPKIDFTAIDSLGRSWQLGTIQLDFNLPERFDLKYKGADNQEHRPVMIHRALLGSIERFLAVLLEQGPLPLWLRLEQVRVIPVHAAQLGYAKEVANSLRFDGIRAYVDSEEAPLSAKIKKAVTDNVPVRAVVGKQEEKDESVTFEGNGHKRTYRTANFVNDFQTDKWGT